MKRRYTPADEAAIDALYGLEPVIDPAREAAMPIEGGELTPFSAVQCPYCGESFETLLDTSAGSSSYIEDCQVCCRPIQMSLEVAFDGTLICLTPARTD